MTSVITNAESPQPETETAVHLFDNWIDPLETEIRERIRGFIEELIRRRARRGTGAPALRAASEEHRGC